MSHVQKYLLTVSGDREKALGIALETAQGTPRNISYKPLGLIAL